MNPMNPRQMLAKALMRTHDTAGLAASAASQLQVHLEHARQHGSATATISMQLAASVAEAQARRNAHAEMCIAIGATQAQVDLALGGDTDAFYELFDALRAN